MSLNKQPTVWHVTKAAAWSVSDLHLISAQGRFSVKVKPDGKSSCVKVTDEPGNAADV